MSLQGNLLLCSLRWPLMLNVIMNKYVQSISKTMKESLMVGPLTRVEKYNRFLAIDDTVVQIVIYLYSLDFCYSM